MFFILDYLVLNQSNTTKVSWGFGSNAGTINFVRDSFAAASAHDYETASTQIINALQSPVIVYRATLQSMDSDGFTIDWEKIGATTGTIQCNFMAFK